MILRMSLMVSLGMLTASNATADLIFSLGPVQFGAPVDGGPATNSPAFIDLLVESDNVDFSDEFFTFGYEITIAAVDPLTSPSDGLFFSSPLFNEPENENYVFFGDSSQFPPGRSGDNLLLQGSDFTVSGENVPLDISDGQRLVVRAELGIQPDLADGLEYLISISTDDFFAGQSIPDGPDADVPLFADDFVRFTTGTNTAAVPEPASVAALTLLVGGIMYRRRKKQV